MGKEYFNKEQRIQLKRFICRLGILLILFLVAGKALKNRSREEEKQETPKKETVEVRSLHNVWILEEDEEGILVFCDGEKVKYPWGVVSREKGVYRPEVSVREQLADVTLSDGGVTDIALKTRKINGKVLGVHESAVELEGYGKIPLAEDYKGYCLFGELRMYTATEIPPGYAFADFCVEDGKICGILMTKAEAMQNIRVLVKTTDYSGLFHINPVVTSDTGFTITYGSYENRKTEVCQAGEEVMFSQDSPYFEGERVLIVPEVMTGKLQLKSVKRSQGSPAYRGTLELLQTEEGIAVINEVSMEEYLYSVVPSEMPAKYPKEALKAQAICARTYAYGHMERPGYPQYGAHVDDSTSFQVYNNIVEQEATTTAVKETYGQLLFTESGTLAETYYYSTSCGIGSDAGVWKTQAAQKLDYLSARCLNKKAMEQCLAGVDETDMAERMQEEEMFSSFIHSINEDDFERDESWYRWSYEVEALDEDVIAKALEGRYAGNKKLVLTLSEGEFVSREIEHPGKITDIYIAKRGAGGVADELIIEGEKATYKVISENYIRHVLNDGRSPVMRQDGSRTDSLSLLPSGFFVIQTEKKKGVVKAYSIVGGGFGHGVGMSQNGAKEMARSGRNAEEILTFFYEDCMIKNVYEEQLYDS